MNTAISKSAQLNLEHSVVTERPRPQYWGSERTEKMSLNQATSARALTPPELGNPLCRQGVT